MAVDADIDGARARHSGGAFGRAGRVDLGRRVSRLRLERGAGGDANDDRDHERGSDAGDAHGGDARRTRDVHAPGDGSELAAQREEGAEEAALSAAGETQLETRKPRPWVSGAYPSVGPSPRAVCQMASTSNTSPMTR